MAVVCKAENEPGRGRPEDLRTSHRDTAEGVSRPLRHVL